MDRSIYSEYLGTGQRERDLKSGGVTIGPRANVIAHDKLIFE